MVRSTRCFGGARRSRNPTACNQAQQSTSGSSRQAVRARFEGDVSTLADQFATFGRSSGDLFRFARFGRSSCVRATFGDDLPSFPSSVRAVKFTFGEGPLLPPPWHSSIAQRSRDVWRRRPTDVPERCSQRSDVPAADV